MIELIISGWIISELSRSSHPVSAIIVRGYNPRRRRGRRLGRKPIAHGDGYAVCDQWAIAAVQISRRDSGFVRFLWPACV